MLAFACLVLTCVQCIPRCPEGCPPGTTLHGISCLTNCSVGFTRIGTCMCVKQDEVIGQELEGFVVRNENDPCPADHPTTWYDEPLKCFVPCPTENHLRTGVDRCTRIMDVDHDCNKYGAVVCTFNKDE